jgi:hypoxanthine phosphoribosyltransferase
MIDQMLNEALAVKASADCVVSEEEIRDAAKRMGAQISQDLADKNPLVITVMNGGLYPAGLLLPHITAPMQLDYLHATRYRGETEGGELVWARTPTYDLTGRHVLIIDDILDEGYTLEAILRCCLTQEPESVSTAVLANKLHDRGPRPDVTYCGVDVPDRYVFGCGMDYKGYWRNLPAIYAVAEG